jgi:hypothetical protein
MEFENLLKIVGDEPVFETGLLLAGNIAKMMFAGNYHAGRKRVASFNFGADCTRSLPPIKK